ncbi:hypothetical protein QR674_05095 [Acinetobacter chinensis]|uniref:Uncharacterized protein n=1 Tax=Acinetobacter chinensis TaxID=2004650 RepID=A0ABU3WD75_9GAMM|nr:hypothetical protein [Acinetobacter chinensis]MDV2468354.1 hypothetical protein [Acinetobacter chinensis]
MLSIYLTDVRKNVQFSDYPGEHPVKFILSFKKIFPSVMELLLPVLPENENLEEMTWESTVADFELFKLLLSGWGVVELRLNALAAFRDKKFADQTVVKIKQKRKEFSVKNNALTSVELDYLFLHALHAQIDAELVEVGEKFYLPVLRDIWKGHVSDKVLNAKF